jgi:hypothetical protein
MFNKRIYNTTHREERMNMILRYFTKIFILMIIAAPLLSQEPPRIGSNDENFSNTPQLANVPVDIEKRCGEFLKKMKNKNMKEAYQEILEQSPILEKKDQISNLIRAAEQSIKFYGEMMDFQPVSSEIVTTSLLRVRYIALHETYPMRFVFTWYKAPQLGWIIINLKYDDLSESFFSDETVY